TGRDFVAGRDSPCAMGVAFGAGGICAKYDGQSTGSGVVRRAAAAFCQATRGSRVGSASRAHIAADYRSCHTKNAASARQIAATPQFHFGFSLVFKESYAPAGGRLPRAPRWCASNLKKSADPL